MTTVIGFAGYSGSGKTTLIAKLIAHLEQKGIRVAVIKHDAHGHYKEAEGSDSAMFLNAGASETLVLSPGQTASFRREAVRLSDALKRLDGRYDLILVEGFKQEEHDKIAVFRDEVQAEIIQALTKQPIAWVTPDWSLASIRPEVPVFHPDDLLSISRFIESRIC